MVLDREGEVVGASWHAFGLQSLGVAGGKGKKRESGENGKGDFDILTTKAAPSVVFDKPAQGKKGATGAGAGAGMAGPEGEKDVVEKTFFQK